MLDRASIQSLLKLFSSVLSLVSSLTIFTSISITPSYPSTNMSAPPSLENAITERYLKDAIIGK